MTASLPLVAALWLIAAGLLLLAGAASGRRPALPLLLTASATYAVGYGFELVALDLTWALHALTLQYVAIAALPLLVVMLAADISGAPWLGRRDVRAGVTAAGLAALALVATNARHDLFHAGAQLEPSGALALLAFEPGPAYVAFQVVMALSVASALIALTATALRRTVPSAVRWQALLAGSGLLVPWLAFALFRVGPLRVDLDLTPLAFAVTSVLAFVALTRLGLADVSPIARSLVFDRTHDPVIVLDAAGAVVDANRAAINLLAALGRDEWRGHDLETLLGLVAGGAVSDDEQHSALSAGQRISLAGRHFDLRRSRVRGRRGAHLGDAVVLRDITEFVALHEALTVLAQADDLTGVANRRHFIERTERQLERDRHDGAPTSLALFDLDRFKAINDAHGHLVGDRVLQHVARAVEQRLRPTDLLGRYGGEEFAVCLPATDAVDARAIAERICDAVRSVAVETEHGVTVSVRASVGVHTVAAQAAATTHAETLEALLARADAAQYAAKRAGGDRVMASTDASAAADGHARPAGA